VSGTGAGKGDRYRPVDRQKWDEGWERIFGKGSKVMEGATVEYAATLKVPKAPCEMLALKRGEEALEIKQKG
jgi:hypothetical protein